MRKVRPRGEESGYLRSDSKQVGNVNVRDHQSEYIANYCKVFFVSIIGEVMPLITSFMGLEWRGRVGVMESGCSDCI